MTTPPKLVLASNSPRRKTLLGLGRLPFEIAPADINEDVLPGEDPQTYVLRLADEKARAAATPYRGQDVVIIAADTTVAHEGRILAKPLDADEARDMLLELRGKEHIALTGLCVLRTKDGAHLTELAVTLVPMRNYSDAEIEAYIASGDPLDKAGAYAIQHAGFHPVAEMRGCFANVAGLPLCHLKRVLAKWEIHLTGDLPTACQAYLNYDCPVTDDILAGRL
jgi:septum formation protein